MTSVNPTKDTNDLIITYLCYS